MHVLEDLYYGNINPVAKCFDRKSEYAKFLTMLVEDEETLTAFLSALPNAEKERQTFSRLINAQSETSKFLEFERFTEGFQLGAGLMLEAFIAPQQSVMRDIC